MGPWATTRSYVGNYSNDVYGQITVTANNDTLVIIAGLIKVKTFLQHWDRDTFRVSTPDLTDNTGFVTFQINPEGTAESLIMNLYLEPRSTVFKRVEE